ncbi:MAG: chemotaxis protein CheW [Salinivirgaceae bacterium]|jgi:purine-binding chemotaxis protein CheW|nr:chemotaxis protein CheW [Salinivirgaceae bacterium]
MEQLKSYLTFKIGKEQFAANASFVHNIIELPKITELPEMPDYMKGVINLRGKVLPIIDSRIKFGVENTEITTNTCIIVMEVTIDEQQVFIGTLVDAVSEVVEIEPEEIKDPPTIGAGVKNDFITGVFQNQDKFTMILDMNKVLSTNELLKVGDLSAADSE